MRAVALLGAFCLAASLHVDYFPASYYESVLAEHPDWGLELQVKFRDHLRLRVGQAGSLMTTESDQTAEIESTLVELKARMRSLYADLPEGKLDNLLARAASLSKRAQPDLHATMQIQFAEDQSPASLVAAAAKFAALASVEYAHLDFLHIPPPVIMETDPGIQCNSELFSNLTAESSTPDFIRWQTYRGVDPGFEANYAIQRGGTGEGISLSDCEYCWIYSHEDVDQTPEPGFETCSTQGRQFDDHGTASVGITSGRDNGFGIQGVAPRASVYTFSEFPQQGYNRPRAIAAAVANSERFDVVLLEMQTTCCGRSAYSPAETVAPVFQIMEVARDAQVIVVAAAGNGNENLDGAPYATYRSWGDSGAIIIGAGDATTLHRKAGFSTYGRRVNVQAWGDHSVMSAGYGQCRFPGSHPGGGNKNRWYTPSYSGTSSASALTAGATTLLQSYCSNAGRKLTPHEMRSLLMETGMPQTGTGGHIGPHINLRNAIEAFDRKFGINQ